VSFQKLASIVLFQINGSIQINGSNKLMAKHQPQKIWLCVATQQCNSTRIAWAVPYFAEVPFNVGAWLAL